VDSETWAPPKESCGIVDPSEIVEILSIYFIKEFRLYHTITYTRTDEIRTALVVDADIYRTRRWFFDNGLCLLVVVMMTLLCILLVNTFQVCI